MSRRGEMPSGMSGSQERLLRFADWARERRGPISWRAVADRFEISRAQAYRWIAAWKAAGVKKP